MTFTLTSYSERGDELSEKVIEVQNALKAANVNPGGMCATALYTLAILYFRQAGITKEIADHLFSAMTAELLKKGD